MALVCAAPALSEPLFQAPFYAQEFVLPLVHLRAADLNGDSHPDLVGITSGSGTAVIALGRADGGFDPPQVYGICAGSSAPIIADLTGEPGFGRQRRSGTDGEGLLGTRTRPRQAAS